MWPADMDTAFNSEGLIGYNNDDLGGSRLNRETRNQLRGPFTVEEICPGLLNKDQTGRGRTG